MYNLSIGSILSPYPRASMDKMYDVLIKNGASHKQCTDLMNEINYNEYDTDSIIIDVMNESDEYNVYKESNLFHSVLNNKYFMKLIKKHFKQKTNDDDKVNRFDLGQYLMLYWVDFKDNNGYISKPKYASLKEETLNNNIHHIDLNTFNHCVNKAFISTYSFKGRALKAQDHGNDNNRYEIPPDLRVTVSHILVIMFYCNLNELQRMYKKKGCRELKLGEDLEAVKTRNKEIGRWYRLLFEAVYFYGSKATTYSVYYTGINVPVCFDSFAPRFRCPISTTTQWSVAHRFSEGLGVVLKMVPAPGCLDQCFNVEWLSDYKSEMERLFFDAEGLQIVDIQYFDALAVRYNADYVSAFRLWSSLFSGEFFNLHLRGKQRERTQKTLIKLIRNYVQNNGIDIKHVDTAENIAIHIYIQRVFYHLMQQLHKQWIYMIQSEFLLLNDSLTKELLSFETESESVVSLSPFLSSLIKASDVRILTEFIWVLSEQEINNLKRQKDKYIVSEEKYNYKLSDDKNVEFQMGIRNESTDEYTGFKLEINKSSLDSVNGIFSVAIDDFNWTKNSWLLDDLKAGESVNVFFFEEKLLNDVQSLVLRIAVFLK